MNNVRNIVGSEGRDGHYRHEEQECSQYHVPSLPTRNIKTDDNQRSEAERTLNASSTVPWTILVHVRCKIVSMPYSSWVNPAISRVRSFVVPPAPHVTLTANGFNSIMRAIRETRFSKPYETIAMYSDDHPDSRAETALLHLVRLWREELKSVE